MKKLVYAVLATIVVLTIPNITRAQRGRGDTADIRERQRQRQLAIENPANNPFKLEPYEPIAPAPPPPTSPLRATIDLQVVDVENGDTLIINNTANQHLRLRLQGIDAPEKGQPFHNDAKEHLARLVLGKSIAVEFDPHGKPDSEGRVVAKALLGDSDIALAQVKAGLAWFCKDYKKAQSESDRYSYAEAEKEARASGLGLWRDHLPVAPWDYRKP
jgi:endonuclease YncB( thermonuclease family)